VTTTEVYLATALPATAFSYLVVEGLRDHLDERGARDQICCDCGYRGMPLTKLYGRLCAEILLGALLIVPGYIYSVWRINTRYPRCATCGSSRAVPASSTIGRRKMRERQSVLDANDDVVGWSYCESTWRPDDPGKDRQ